jgi:hypothetical protein
MSKRENKQSCLQQNQVNQQSNQGNHLPYRTPQDPQNNQGNHPTYMVHKSEGRHKKTVLKI